MPYLLLAVFIALPLLEIGVFIEVGGRIGLWWTLTIVVLTALAGTWLLRLQGLATLRRAQESLQRNELPLTEVFDGACLLLAGALLLTPGFVTDGMGLLLFLPPVRAGLRRLLARYVTVHTAGGPSTAGDGTIEGEWEEVKEPPPPVAPPRRG
jgi:UPF0716 protein FxsA